MKQLKILHYPVKKGIITIIVDNGKSSISHNKAGHLLTINNDNKEESSNIIMEIIKGLLK